jgi:hypothetical protein
LTIPESLRPTFILPRAEQEKQKETNDVGESKGKVTGGFCNSAYSTKAGNGKEIEKVPKTPIKKSDDSSDSSVDSLTISSSFKSFPKMYFPFNKDLDHRVYFNQKDLWSMGGRQFRK